MNRNIFISVIHHFNSIFNISDNFMLPWTTAFCDRYKEKYGEDIADKINVSNVVNLDDLKKYLNNFYDGTSYSVEEMDKIYDSILRSVGDITNREHVKNIRNTQKDLKNGICPRCGGKLVERNGKYGKFYGCSSYPNCRFVLNDK